MSSFVPVNQSWGQHYAMTHGRTIVANAEVVRHLKDHKLRLLPVDVLATGRQAARVD